MVANDTEDRRSRLSLLASRDGIIWKRLHIVEMSGKDSADEYSYPSIVGDGEGAYHLVYTWKRKAIRHVVFTESWVRKKISGLRR